MAVEQKVTVASPTQAVIGMAEHLLMVRSLMGGTYAMRKNSIKFLPAWPNEDPETYRTRLNVSTLFPAYSRTVSTLAGKPFSKPLTMSDDMPEQIKLWMDMDCDMQGRNLHTFGACILESALAYGMTGILVEYPRVDKAADQILTQAQEQELGLRPYFVQIEPWDIIGWRSKRINGVETLMQLRFYEHATIDEGEWGEKEIRQVRVLTPGAWEIHRKDENGDWKLFDSGSTTLPFIPFVMVYGHRTGFMTSKPPMLEMANLNVKHWQSQSDQDNILHVVRVPILTVVGVDDDKFTMTIGASSAVKLPMGASAGFVEHSGSSVGAGREALEDLKEEMRQAGAELLVLQPGAITATQVGTENAVGMCALQRIVEACEDAFDTALKYLGKWINVPEVGKVTLFKDFGAATLAEASAQLLITQNQAGKLSDVTTLTELKRRGILAADVDVEEELARIEEQGPPLGTVGADGMPVDGAGAAGDRLPAGSPNEPEAKQNAAEPPEPVDLQPVLDAIAAIKIPEAAEPAESPAAPDFTPMFNALQKQIAELAVKVEEPATAEMDLTPMEDALAKISSEVAALSATVADMKKADPSEEAKEAKEAQDMADLKKGLTDLATKLEAKPLNSDLPQKVVPIRKQIQIVTDAEGNIIGADVIETPVAVNS